MFLLLLYFYSKDNLQRYINNVIFKYFYNMILCFSLSINFKKYISNKKITNIVIIEISKNFTIINLQIIFS